MWREKKLQIPLSESGTWARKVYPRERTNLLGESDMKKETGKPKTALVSLCFWNLNEHGDERAKTRVKKQKCFQQQEAAKDPEESVIYSYYSQEGGKLEADSCVILKGSQERQVRGSNGKIANNYSEGKYLKWIWPLTHIRRRFPESGCHRGSLKFTEAICTIGLFYIYISMQSSWGEINSWNNFKRI